MYWYNFDNLQLTHTEWPMTYERAWESFKTIGSNKTNKKKHGYKYILSMVNYLKNFYIWYFFSLNIKNSFTPFATFYVYVLCFMFYAVHFVICIMFYDFLKVSIPKILLFLLCLFFYFVSFKLKLKICHIFYYLRLKKSVRFTV